MMNYCLYSITFSTYYFMSSITQNYYYVFYLHENMCGSLVLSFLNKNESFGNGPYT